jgi:site-specific DNA recombinase
MLGEQVTVAIYARVSSSQQAEAGTIESQIEALLERVRDDGLVADDELKFMDEGYSGSTLVRPALERLRDLAAVGAIDRLYVHSPDRLARKYAYQVLLIEELQGCGVEVKFLNHEMDPSPEQELLLQVQGVVAEYERAKIMERSRRGKRHAAHQGSVSALTGAPYGYRYVRKQEGGGEASYDLVFSEARVIQQIFQWVAEDRLPINEICRRLGREGIPTRTGKSLWDRSTVYRMLTNPAYKGRAAFGKRRAGTLDPRRLRPQRGQSGHPRRAVTFTKLPQDQWISISVPAIVSEELFGAVQEQLAENRRRSRASMRGARYLLRGLLVCQQCAYALHGCRMYDKSANGDKRYYTYYRCSGTDPFRFGGQRVCGAKLVRADLLDEAVWEDVCSLLADPQRVAEEYERRMASRSSHGDAQWSIEHLQESLRKVKRGMGRIVDAYEGGWLEKSDFEQRMRGAKNRLERLEAQVRVQAEHEAQQRELRLVIGRLSDFADRVAEGLQEADWATRRDIIRAMVKEIQVDDETVRIVYRVDPPAVADSPDRGSLHYCGGGAGGSWGTGSDGGRRRRRTSRTDTEGSEPARNPRGGRRT